MAWWTQADVWSRFFTHAFVNFRGFARQACDANSSWLQRWGCLHWAMFHKCWRCRKVLGKTRLCATVGFFFVFGPACNQTKLCKAACHSASLVTFQYQWRRIPRISLLWKVVCGQIHSQALFHPGVVSGWSEVNAHDFVSGTCLPTIHENWHSLCFWYVDWLISWHSIFIETFKTGLVRQPITQFWIQKY